MAATILAYALCGLLAMYVNCFGLIAISRNVSIATTAAQGLIEEIRDAPFTNITDDYANLKFTVNNMPSNKGVVYVDEADPELLRVTISVCWREGPRVIGEDTNLNGVLDSGEDASPYNGIIDSVVELVTQVANR